MQRVVLALKRQLKSRKIFRPALCAIYGSRIAATYFPPQRIFGRHGVYREILRTGETSNFTYELAEPNLRYLAELVSLVVKRPYEEIARYLREPDENTDLLNHLSEAMRSRGLTLPIRQPFGRRLGWYAFVRALKPKVVVETGVERGHGALLLCAALKQNAEEGFPGKYFGTDIDPTAGWLLSGSYRCFGKILYGDSIASLNKLDEIIDVFANDSDHSSDYEAEEYEAVRAKLSSNAIVLGDNAHVTDALFSFARRTNRRFLFFPERPKNHWYSGGGIGIAFRD